MIIKFFRLTFYLITGKINGHQYINKVAFKIRETLVKSTPFRRIIRALFSIDRVKIRPEELDDWKKMRGSHMIEPGPIDEMPKRKETSAIKNIFTMPANRVINKHSYIADYKGKIIGSISMSPMKGWREQYGFDGYMISGSHVSPWYRGLGIGEALYRALIERAKEDSLPVLYQTINRSNKRNIKLAYKLGFSRPDKEIEEKLINKARMYAFYIDLRETAREKAAT